MSSSHEANDRELDLNDLRIFVAVVDAKGIVAASHQLGLSKSSVSSRVTRLERALGTQLMRRTPTHITITEAGAGCYEHAREVLAHGRAATESARRRNDGPGGTLRFGSHASMCHGLLADLVPVFLGKHPSVRLLQVISSNPIDLMKEGLDAVLWAHFEPLADSSLVRVPICSVPLRLFGARDKVWPVTAADLKNQPGLLLQGRRPEWRLNDGSETTVIRFTPRVTSDDVAMLVRCAEAGLGLAALPEFLCHDSVRNGRLTSLLPTHTVDTLTFTALLPPGREHSPGARAWLGLLRASLPAAVGAR